MAPHFGFAQPVPPPPADEVARLIACDPSEAPDAAVPPSLVSLQAHGEQVELARLRYAAALDGRTIFAGDGARSAGAWLAARLGIAAKHASALVHDGRVLRHCAVTEAAWHTGRIGAAKARPLLRARDVHPRLFSEHEPGLIDAIEPLTVAQAVIVINRWKACATDIADHERHAAGCDGDPGGCGPDCGQQPDPADGNRFYLSATVNGRRVGELDLDATNGSLLETALEAWIDARWHDGTFHTDDGLHTAQRRALALVDLCCQSLPRDTNEPCDTEETVATDVPVPTTAEARSETDVPCDTDARDRRPGAVPSAQSRHGERRPSISLLLDAKTLFGLPIDNLDDLLARRCELADGTLIPLPTAQRLLCSASVQQFLTRITSQGTIETIGVTDRLRDATRQQRRAVRLRDGGCLFPGCTVPFDRCQIHHLTPYELDGPTLVNNLATLCSHHHHLVHEGRWRLWRTHDGQLHLVKPDRTYVPVVGHGQAPLPDRPPGTGPPPPAPLPIHHRTPSRPNAPPGDPPHNSEGNDRS